MSDPPAFFVFLGMLPSGLLPTSYPKQKAPTQRVLEKPPKVASKKVLPILKGGTLW